MCWAASVLSLLSQGCGEEASCGETSKYPLDRPFEEHACLHVANGPFETVPAAVAGRAPELRNTHVAYTVPLAQAAGVRAGKVMFKPRVDGPFAFFVDVETPLRLDVDSGKEVCPAAVHPVSACSGLRRVHFYDLRRKVEYELTFGPTAPDKVLVVVEDLVLPEGAP